MITPPGKQVRMITPPGKQVTWGEVNIGARQVFEDAGFGQVSHPTNVAS